jgi:hypothetical protein
VNDLPPTYRVAHLEHPPKLPQHSGRLRGEELQDFGVKRGLPTRVAGEVTEIDRMLLGNRFQKALLTMADRMRLAAQYPVKALIKSEPNRSGTATH